MPRVEIMLPRTEIPTTDDKTEVEVCRRVNDLIRWYEQSANRRMHEYNILKFMQIFAGSSIPVISIFEPVRWTRITIGILGGSVGVIGYWLQSRNAFKNWPRWRRAAEQLKREKQFFITRSGPYENLENPETFFHKQVEDIATAEHEEWQTLMKNEPSVSGASHNGSKGKVKDNLA